VGVRIAAAKETFASGIAMPCQDARAAKSRRIGAVGLTGLLAGAALALTGCDVPQDTTRQVVVLGGEVRVRAPQFYCVDTETAQSVADTAVVLIGRCNATGQVAAALVTVTVGRFASAGVMLASTEALRDFMASPAGRRVLSRSGRAEDVEVLESGVLDDQLMLHLNDRLAGEYWRAIIGIKGRLITISASGTEGVTLTPDAGRKLVEQTVDATRDANPANGG
jgi:hypothetical protein